MSHSWTYWPAWSITSGANSPACVMLDGTIKLQDVMMMIHTVDNVYYIPSSKFILNHVNLFCCCFVYKQLEILKTINFEQAQMIIELQKKSENDKDRNERALKKLNDRIDKELRDTLLAFDKKNDNSDVNPQFVTDLFEKADEKINTLQTRLASHDISILNINRSYQVNDDLRTKLTKRVTDTEEKLDELLSNGTVQQRIVKLEDEAFWAHANIIKTNTDIELIIREADSTKDRVKTLTATTQEHGYHIDALEINKMNREDIEMLIQVATNAHRSNVQQDLEALSDSIDQVDKKILALSHEVQGKFDASKDKTDKKIEFMTKWIIKHIKENFIPPDNADEGNYTDIGKVPIRCLVCNQPTKKVETDTTYRNPDFITTIALQHNHDHRPKSPDPPTTFIPTITTTTVDDPKYKIEATPKKLMLPKGKLAALRATVSFAQKEGQLANIAGVQNQQADGDDFENHFQLSMSRTFEGGTGRTFDGTSNFYKDMEK